MKPVIVLLFVFALSSLTIKIVYGRYDMALAARIAMAAMLTFTAIGHFVYTKGMSLMLPEPIPFREAIVYATGILEIGFAIGLLIPKLQFVTGWLLILFLILILPSNIYAAVKHLDYQKATYTGSGITYLYFRIPAQILFILWTYLCAVKPNM